jgi:hypothetical protein
VLFLFFPVNTRHEVGAWQVEVPTTHTHLELWWRREGVELHDDSDDLQHVVNELMTVDLARTRRDDLLCVETGFIVQEAHVQLGE